MIEKKILLYPVFIIISFFSCKEYKYTFENVIGDKKPKNCYYEVYKDFNFIDRKGITKLKSNDLRNSFILFREKKNDNLKSFIFINGNAQIEIDMKRIPHNYYDVYVGENKIFMSDFARKDTLLYLNNDTLIYNSTFIEENFSLLDTVQFNFIIYKVQNESNQLAIGLKMSRKDFSIKNLSPASLTYDHFNGELLYKSFFVKEQNHIVNKNVYSAEANGRDPRMYADSWTKTFAHLGRLYYPIFKNYEYR